MAGWGIINRKRCRSDGPTAPPISRSAHSFGASSRILTTTSVICIAVICLLFFPLALSTPTRAAVPFMSLPGQWNVDNVGSFNYTVPIRVPPGTRGMVPHVALTYSSRGGDGYVGIGWSLAGLSAITRCPQTYAQDAKHGGVNFDVNDRFCLDGQRLVLISGSYGTDGSQYVTEIESFRKIVFHTQGTNCGVSCFDVWTRDGTHYQYGYTVNSNGNASGAQIYAYNTSNIVRVWALNQTTDTKGNYVAYSYTGINGDADYVPNRIDYTGNSGQGGNATYNSIRFVYQTRSDIVPSYKAGYLIQPQELLTDIETYNLANLILDYKLSYTYAALPTTPHNELDSVTLYDNASRKIAPTTFGWQGSGLTPAVTETPVVGLSPGDGVAAADVNGDGLTDALVLTTNCYAGGDVFTGTQSGSFQSANMQATYDYFPNGNDTPTKYSGPACFQNEETVVGDINADGLADLSIDIDYYVNGRKVPSAEILVNDGHGNLVQQNADGQFAAPFIFSRPFDQFPSDFNGDGLTDGVWLDTSNYHLKAEIGDGSGKNFSQFDLGAIPGGTWWYAGDFAGNGCSSLLLQGGVTETAIFCDPASSQNQVNFQTFSAPNFGTWNNGNGVILGDFNGDGLTDVLALTQTAAKLYLSTGNGFAAPINITFPWTNCTVVAGDWNGDGKTDIALISQNKQNHIFYLSTGTSFTQVGSGIPNSDGPNSPTVADWNNDGAADVLIQIPQGSVNEITFSFKPELMTTVSNGLGATTTATYDRLNHATIYTKGSGATYPMQDVNGAMYAVSSVQTAGAGTTKSWNYTYTGLEVDHSGRGMLVRRSVPVPPFVPS